jgi:hypothetical protein
MLIPMVYRVVVRWAFAEGKTGRAVVLGEWGGRKDLNALGSGIDGGVRD